MKSAVTHKDLSFVLPPAPCGASDVSLSLASA